jgi:hypothetical protein
VSYCSVAPPQRFAPGPIRLALGIEDPALADRLAALLAGVPGVRLVGANEAADAAVVPFTAVSASAEGDFRRGPNERCERLRFAKDRGQENP